MKDGIASKVTQIQIKYRNTMLMLEKKNGGGCTVTTFFDICSEIVGGSPETESMSSGREAFNQT